MVPAERKSGTKKSKICSFCLVPLRIYIYCFSSFKLCSIDATRASADKVKRTSPEYCAGVHAIEDAIAGANKNALTLDGLTAGNPALAKAFEDVALYTWNDVLQQVDPALAQQDERFEVQIAIFGHPGINKHTNTSTNACLLL